MKIFFFFATACFVSMASFSARADSDAVTINVTGTLTKAPCKLLTPQNLTASFGSLRTDEIANTHTYYVPIILSCPDNSSMNVSIKASGVVSGTPNVASAGKENLAYLLLWDTDKTPADLNGVPRVLTNQTGTVDLSVNVKLVALGELTEGAFTASSVMSIEYL
jgi:type 1 fimbria pilin